MLRAGALPLALFWLGGSLAMSPAPLAEFRADPKVGPYGTTAEPVVQRFLSRPDEAPKRYGATRRLEARNVRFNKHGWLEAWTELEADGRFRYQVLREGGSPYIRDRVLRPMLDNEERLFATRDAGRAAVTLDNYEVRGAERAAPGLFRLLVRPKRPDVSLVDGALYVTEHEADLVRLEGRLSKNPSFWTRRVDIVRRYQRLSGVRVPVRLDSVAQVRFAGTSTLSVTYAYQMIDGVVLSAATVVAPIP